MAKANKDKDGFLVLNPIPGGTFEKWQSGRLGKKTKKDKIPKDPDKLIDIFADEYGMDAISDMTEVDIGDYVYEKGINHSLNMNVGRNIPWVEDGLKSVERRILYTLYKTKAYNGNFVKVATAAGAIIANFHPHGDQALADTIYRLGRTRSIMIPYIAAGGNYGNMEDMRPAAPRYASASLSQYAMDCFFSEMGAKFPIFDVKDNYNYSEKEPVFLTSRYPNILMQWNQGIGKGAASWLGAFNSKDVFNATLKMLDDPKAKIDIYPDTPVPIDIINKNELKHCFDQKKFKVKMRAKYKVVPDKKRDEHGRVVDKFTIVFTSLPLNTTGKTVKDEIIAINAEDQKKANADKKLPEVLNVEVSANDNTPGGVEVIVEYEKGYDPNALAEKLFRSTSLGTTVGVQYVLVSDNQLHEYTPRQILMNWINLRYDQKRRFYHQQALKAAKDRSRLEASCTLLESNNVDKAIQLIKTSKDDAEAIQKLMKAFKFTEFQASIVIRLELRTLNRMNVEDLRKQRDQALADYKHYRKLLSDEDAIKEAIRDELQEGLKKYGHDRLADVFTLKDQTAGDPSGEKVLYWNNQQYLAITNDKELHQVKEALDKTYHVMCIQNSDKILVFAKNGQVKLLDGYAFTGGSIPISFQQIGFTDVAGMIKLNKNITDVVLTTKFGYGKILQLDDILNALKSKVISLGQDDSLVGVDPLLKDDQDGLVMLIVDDRVYYVKLEDYPRLKRVALGNRILKVDEKNPVLGTCFIPGMPEHLLVYGEFGYAKVLDTSVMKFNKRKPNSITFGKSVMGVVPIYQNQCFYKIIDMIHPINLTITVDNMVRMTTDSGETQKFRIGTTISSPVKILKRGRNEFYSILYVYTKS